MPIPVDNIYSYYVSKTQIVAYQVFFDPAHYLPTEFTLTQRDSPGHSLTNVEILATFYRREVNEGGNEDA